MTPQVVLEQYSSSHNQEIISIHWMFNVKIKYLWIHSLWYMRIFHKFTHSFIRFRIRLMFFIIMLTRRIDNNDEKFCQSLSTLLLVFNHHSISQPESNRQKSVRVRVRFGSTLFRRTRFWFGSVRLYFEKHGSSSVRFDFILKNMVWVRFSSTLFEK